MMFGVRKKPRRFWEYAIDLALMPFVAYAAFWCGESVLGIEHPIWQVLFAVLMMGAICFGLIYLWRILWPAE